MYDASKVKKVQDRLLYMAVLIRDCLEKHKIPYWITYGTLLGAVRHKGFIPWDDDFDFYLFEDTYDTAIEILKKELPDTLFVEDKNSEPLFFHAWNRIKDLKTHTENHLFPQDNVYQHHGLNVDLYKAYKMPLSEELPFKHNAHIAYLERRKKLGIIESDTYNQRIHSANQAFEQDFATSPNKNNNQLVYTFPGRNNIYITLDELFPLKQYSFNGYLFYGPNNPHLFLQRCYGDYMKLPPTHERKPHFSAVTFL